MTKMVTMMRINKKLAHEIALAWQQKRKLDKEKAE